ncbi:hypothetical protein GCM10011416_08080 [Polaribacter pacificus]|uniref:DUF481 domain-containing protein n=1 Tax=Polaribacter pacificus TaxID=1775173 RepID=A0A917HX30_9FLAO|nr:DUF481 domain-containing protein [Polaribacter pacificus]GGG93349.1 hypothetical protein GCM10011416_08080 [Polaribacter pacificus]
MQKLLFFLGFLFCYTLVNAQVINIENLRKDVDDTGFYGTVSLDLELSKNTNTIFAISNELRLQYTSGKNNFMLINEVDFKELNKNKYTNKSVQHLRYNYSLTKTTTLEAFIQIQKDRVSFINHRTLIGAGTRFKISKKPNYRFFIGTLIMYEHENSLGVHQDVIDQDFRANMYVSFGLYPSKNLRIINTTYYQPKIKTFSDYRVSSETTLGITVFRNLLITTSFSYQFDTLPVLGVPLTQYKLENGITYTF